MFYFLIYIFVMVLLFLALMTKYEHHLVLVQILLIIYWKKKDGIILMFNFDEFVVLNMIQLLFFMEKLHLTKDFKILVQKDTKLIFKILFHLFFYSSSHI